MTTDPTHDPALRSWVAGADAPGTDFPLQNLPFGCFRPAAPQEGFRIGVAIGTQVLDLRAAAQAVKWPARTAELLELVNDASLNRLMAAGSGARRELRAALSAMLRHDTPQQDALRSCLHEQSAIELSLPCTIGDYTDFYTGIHHAMNVGRLMRPDNPLLPNYKWVPIGYHGRCSSIVPSGQPVRRPLGQTKAADAAPRFGPSARLDYELELGFLIGPGNAQGEPIAISRAEEHLFGVTLLNDWSARDIQSWEYQPLGPFLSKSFASTLSPWVVTMEALAPFRAPLVRPEGDPKPLPHLDSPETWSTGAIDIRVEAWIQTARMREQGQQAVRISAASTGDAAYWTPAQLVAHHTSNGCNLRPGDLFGSGTLSGMTPEQAGSLIEMTAGGKNPVALPNGEKRSFLEDGDSLTLTAYCERDGARRIGFGACAGMVLPALD